MIWWDGRSWENALDLEYFLSASATHLNKILDINTKPPACALLLKDCQETPILLCVAITVTFAKHISVCVAIAI